MLMIRVILFPGYVLSKTDGNRYFITANQLADLVNIPLNECLIMRKRDIPGYKKQPYDIEVHPRYDGNYSLKQFIKEQW